MKNSDVLYKKEPFEHIIIKNFFTEEEYTTVDDEIKFLEMLDLFSNENDRNKTGTALNDENKPIANRKALFLNDVYKNFRSSSKIYKICRKIFSETVTSQGTIGKVLINTNQDNILISLYDNSDYYLNHRDFTVITCLIYLWDKDINTEGGELRFSDHDYVYSCENNTCIIFYGAVPHEVTKITSEKSTTRKTISLFLGTSL